MKSTRRVHSVVVLGFGVIAACALSLAVRSFVRIRTTRAEQAQQQPRHFYGHRLEPEGDVVLHGAGQSDVESFNAYTHAVAPSTPMLFMSYVDLKADLPAYFARLQAQLNGLAFFAVPQIGLSLNGDEAKQHYEAAVADGSLEAQLNQLCTGLRSLDRPVYLRPGYEFNGAWNGYASKPYIAAFRHIVEKVRACGLENVAFVWDWSADTHATVSGKTSWRNFYPGDAWVDWWGINLFAAEDFSGAGIAGFLSDADAHKFPVMIAESSAKQQPLDKPGVAIDQWFAPMFSLIRSTPGIKAFCYIDWDWTRYPQWADWGDARIERSPAVLAFYRSQIASPLFADARDRAATLKLLRAK